MMAFGQAQYVSYIPEASKLVNAGQHYELQLTFEVIPGYYIQADQDQITDENLIPTQLFPKIDNHLTVCEITYSKAKVKWIGDEQNQVFEGRFVVNIEIETTDYVVQGLQAIQGDLYYQVCDASKCYFPKTLEFDSEIASTLP